MTLRRGAEDIGAAQRTWPRPKREPGPRKRNGVRGRGMASSNAQTVAEQLVSARACVSPLELQRQWPPMLARGRQTHPLALPLPPSCAWASDNRGRGPERRAERG